MLLGHRQKGESVISVAIAAVVVLLLLTLQQKWQPAVLKDVASSAQEFILEGAGIRGQIPEIPGYEKVKSFRLGRYRAVLYRARPAPLLFAAGRFVVYNRAGQSVFDLDTLEGSKDRWTEPYDFAGHRGLTSRGNRARPDYARSITGNGKPDVIIGQYSGGDHCCTTASVIELRNDSVAVLARIDGLDGLPFEGLELRKVDQNPAWEIIAHRPVPATCGSREDAADLLSVYVYADGHYSDQTARFGSLLEGILHQNLAKWAQEKARSLQLLQTLAVNYAELGRQDQASQFLATNLEQFKPQLQKQGIDPDVCLEDLKNYLVDLEIASPSP